MDVAAALAMCSDFVIRTDDGELPASKFVMAQASSLIATVLEDTQLEKDAGGRDVCTFPGLRASFLKPAVDWLHSSRDPPRSLQSIRHVLEGLEFLCVGDGVDALYTKMWDLVRREDLAVFAAHMNTLIHTPHLPGVLQRFSELVPFWGDACRFIDALDITPSISQTTTRILARHFPANLVFHKVLDNLTKSSASLPDDFLKLLGSSGTHYLPTEMPGVLDHLTSALAARGASSVLVDFVKNVKLAVEVYDVVPHTPRLGVQGSIIAFQHTPLCSLALDIVDMPRTRVARRKLAPWLFVEFDFAQASLEGSRLRVASIDDPLAKTATCFEVRVLSINPKTRAVAEMWFCYTHVSPQDWLTLSNASAKKGDQAAFRRLFAAPASTHIRIDVFFGALSPLAQAASAETVTAALLTV